MKQGFQNRIRGTETLASKRNFERQHSFWIAIQNEKI